MATGGAMTIGDIQAFIQYVRPIYTAHYAVANISNMLQQTAAAAERVFEFLNEEEERRIRLLFRSIEQSAGYGYLFSCGGQRTVCTCSFWISPR